MRSRRPITLSRQGARMAAARGLTWRELLEVGLVPPMIGAEDGGGAGGEGGGGEGGAGGEGGGGEGGAGGEGGGGGDWKPPTRDEWDRMQEAVASANKAKRDAERAAASKASKDKKDAGKFEELYNETSGELERVRGVVSRNAIRDAVSDAARRLNFRNPAVAHRNIDLAGVDAEVDLTGDEPNVSVDQATKTLIERRLTALAEAEPYMIEPGGPRQLPGAGQGGGGGNGGGNAAMNAAIRHAAGR